MTTNVAKLTRCIYDVVRKNGEEHLDESAKDTLFVVSSLMAETLDFAVEIGEFRKAKQRIHSDRIKLWIKILEHIEVIEENFERDLEEEKKAAEEAEREAERKEELAALAATKDPEEF